MPTEIQKLEALVSEQETRLRDLESELKSKIKNLELEALNQRLGRLSEPGPGACWKVVHGDIKLAVGSRRLVFDSEFGDVDIELRTGDCVSLPSQAFLAFADYVRTEIEGV
jgi:uncharacterized protein HemX